MIRQRLLSLTATAAIVLQFAIVPASVDAANGHDDPGTTITNSASATYKDGSGNSYNTTSNTVTVTVQNAPSLTVTAGTGTTYAPGQVVTDSFVLANTGNYQGDFQVSDSAAAPTSSSDAVIAGSDASSATLGNGASTCTTPAGSQSAPCKYAALVGGTTYYFTSLDATSTDTSLDHWLANTATPTAAGSSITVYVYYTMASSTTPGAVSSQIYASVTYAAVGSAPAETSAYANGTESNTIAADARLDLYKTSSQDSSTGDITYTISAHNAQAFAAKDLQSVGTLLGTGGVKGVAITDAVPQFGGSPLHLSNSGTVTVTTNNTYGWGGGTASIYYSTSATGASGSWVSAGASPATLPTNGTVYYIAVFMHGGTCGSAGFELCADSGHATSPGNVNVASAAAVQLSFTIVQPTGTGAGVAGSVKNGANGLIGDNQPTEHILGGNIPGLTT
ncbi:MAG TPA: hypothetical protein VFN49_07620, partial [Candidatus Aquilonibacter sp.]|nr:hypothetical protein [Candidatus Aquilonibacter sp.]